MATKKSTPKVEHDAIVESLKKEKGYDKSNVLSSNDNEVIVALGYSRFKNAKLVRVDLKSKQSSLIYSDASKSFDEFLKVCKSKI